jgi:hypothetical protein
VTGATLRVYSTVALSGGGVQVHPAPDGWDESTTSWANQPAWNTSVLATSGTPTAPGWLSIPVPPPSVAAGGPSDFGLAYSTAGMIDRLASREDPADPPQLVVTTAPAPTTTTVPATADTYVYNGAVTQNFGSATPLLSSAGSYRTLLRFDTSFVGPGVPVSSLALRLYATVGLASGGVQVRPESDTWSEGGTSWSDQPAWSSQLLATSATQSSAGWIVVSLPTSALVPGANTSLGLGYSLAGMIERIASREDPAHAPQLVVMTG